MAYYNVLIPVLCHKCRQGRINHCAGCTMGGVPAGRGPPINCQIFTTLF